MFVTSTSPTPSNTQGSDQVEKDLAHLINVSGKLRMLSHQLVMCALLHDCTGQRISFPQKLSDALDEFDQISAEITGMSAHSQLDSATQELLRGDSIISPAQRQTLKDFSTRAAALRDTLSADQAADLGAFAAGELLGALNAINENIRSNLDERISARQQSQEPLLRATSSSLDEINRLSRTLQLVAMNASLEAQRAGENGAAFGEIAREMRELSNKSMDQAKRLESDLAHFKASQTTTTGRPITP